ncbi:unnamed protein product [Nippostrongylus brasiliensis]|uniref:DDE_3 domain-containing protein n=1 Tax=Nippostrongylus brasiliensis TaxID=27835 RepID=A0A0N4XUY5_NIPBR|nr:unnamed protein product [Nippostrongylus brasiliensis]
MTKFNVTNLVTRTEEVKFYRCVQMLTCYDNGGVAFRFWCWIMRLFFVKPSHGPRSQTLRRKQYVERLKSIELRKSAPGLNKRVAKAFVRNALWNPSAIRPREEMPVEKEPYVFQQDGAPAHKAKLVQEWCRSNLTDFVAAKDWPPNCPDLNPLDYSIWAVLEKKVCSTRHSSLDSLKAALVKAWDELDNDYLRRTVDAFPKRLRSCNRQKGGRIERF